MVQQTSVTLTGYVGADPKMINQNGKTPCCLFRVASTRRYFNRKSGQWEDLPTTWMSVKAYRQLAVNIKESVSCGDPVIVSGQLVSSRWEDEQGNARTSLSLEAQSVGHDLTRGVSRFRRIQQYPADFPADGADEEPAGMQTSPDVNAATGEIASDHVFGGSAASGFDPGDAYPPARQSAAAF